MATRDGRSIGCHQRLRRYAPGRGTGQPRAALRQVLKALGFQVTPSRMLDVCRSLDYMDITRRDDFYDAARVNLVSHRDELPLFEEAFKNFWEPENQHLPILRTRRARTLT